MKKHIGSNHWWEIPDDKKWTGPICYYSAFTGYGYTNSRGKDVKIPSDLDDEVHNGFTIGRGKVMYWMMLWHKSGHVSVFSIGRTNDEIKRRWLDGSTEITIHFK